MHLIRGNKNENRMEIKGNPNTLWKREIKILVEVGFHSRSNEIFIFILILKNNLNTLTNENIINFLFSFSILT